MKSRKLYKKEWIEWAIENGINFTQEEIEAAVQKHNDIMSQSAPLSSGARLKPLSRTPNHAVGECYKPNSELNIHDPDNQYVWADADAEVPAWVWVMRALGAFGFMVGIYCLVFLGMLL